MDAHRAKEYKFTDRRYPFERVRDRLFMATAIWVFRLLVAERRVRIETDTGDKGLQGILWMSGRTETFF